MFDSEEVCQIYESIYNILSDSKKRPWDRIMKAKALCRDRMDTLRTEIIQQEIEEDAQQPEYGF